MPRYLIVTNPNNVEGDPTVVTWKEAATAADAADSVRLDTLQPGEQVLVIDVDHIATFVREDVPTLVRLAEEGKG